jgi:predicted DsbA family dithiol-disulfide isomerase
VGKDRRRAVVRPHVRIEIWSDVVCPWCYVGKARFEQALDALEADGTAVDVTVTYRAYQLDPRVPREGQPLDAYLERKLGSRGAMAAMRARLDEAAAGLGIDFRWDGMVRRNTLDAHRLLAWTLRTDGPTRQTALKDRLLRAYFTDGLDVADPGVLAGLAADVGLDHALAAEALATGDGADEVRADQTRAREHGIAAVPSFVIEDRWMLQGALEPAAWQRALPRMAADLADQPATGGGF